MKKTWFSFILIILVLALIKPLNIDYDFTSIIFVLLHSSFMIITLMTHKNNKMKIILVSAFLLRLILVFLDVYANDIFILPNAGTDDIGFYNSARLISENLSLLRVDIYGELYSKFIGLIFYLTGASRVLGGYINVIFGMSVIFITLKTLKYLDIPKQITLFSVFILSFFPNSLFMSAMFRREIIITFLVAYSLYYFVKWFFNGRNYDFFLSIIFVLIGSMLHSGIIGLIVGYIFAYIFYKQSKGKIEFSTSSILYFLIISSTLILLYALFGEQFLAKFGEVEGIDDIIHASNLGGGDARYLENLTITNPIELIVYTPVKIFYFLFSPVPWEWRGIPDILTFVFDSSFYLLCVTYFLKNRKYFVAKNPFILILILSLLATTVIFGIGVGNAGTAMRHRQKINPLFIILLASMLKEKQGIKLSSKTKLIHKNNQTN